MISTDIYWYLPISDIILIYTDIQINISYDIYFVDWNFLLLQESVKNFLSTIIDDINDLAILIESLSKQQRM